MISWISSWAQGIIMAVIIGAIIEMILPEGNSKKYVKIVIGVYVLFTIISPVISKITGKTIQVSDILELNKYIEETENNSKLYVTLDEDNSNNIKDIYESSLRNDIKAKVAAKGYNAKNIKLEIEDDEEYTLKKIDIEIYKNMEKDKKDIETIQNVDINISQKSTENDMQEKLSEKDKRKLKDYLSGVYEIDEKKENPDYFSSVCTINYYRQLFDNDDSLKNKVNELYMSLNSDESFGFKGELGDLSAITQTLKESGIKEINKNKYLSDNADKWLEKVYNNAAEKSTDWLKEV